MYLTGGLRLDGPDGSFTDADLPGNQGRLAFAALVVERRTLERDALAEIVWNGTLPPKWDGALSTIISKLRSLLVRTGLDARAVVPAVGGTYAIVLPHDAWVDVEDATRRLDRAEGALRHGDVDVATAEGTTCSAVFRRPFLPGIDGEWVESRRRTHAEARYRCSVVLARAWIARGDPGLAVTIATDAIRLDPIREVGHQLLIEGELARGDRGAAKRAFEQCRDVLDRELGVEPSPVTRALVT